jgi:hypothetical protein
MSVYEDAVKDAKQFVDVATRHAQEQLLGATMPQLRQLIENEIINAGDEEDLDLEPEVSLTEPDAAGNVTLTVTPAVNMADVQQPALAAAAAVPAIPTPPPPSMPDPTVAQPQKQQATTQVIVDASGDEAASLERNVTEACEAARVLLAAKIARKTQGYCEQIVRLRTRMADMYTQVSAGKGGDAARRLGEALERSLAALAVGETLIMKRKQLREGDITLKLTGVPDDIDLENVGVEIESDEEGGEGEGGEAGEDGEHEEHGGEGDEIDFGGGGGDEGGEEHNEAEQLDDDTVIEIDEADIRNEIARLRKMREAEARPDNRGHGPGKPESYGDGDDEGDPLDVKVVTERNVGKLRTLKTEALRKGNLRLYRECKDRIARLTREAPIRQDRATSARPARTHVIGGAATGALRESRAQLATANLHNAQLAHANKLLLRHDMTAEQKRQALQRLTRAKSVREVTLVYESVVGLLNGKAQLNEGRQERKILGSSSRTAGSGASTMSEGIDAARWSTLAGLTS